MEARKRLDRLHFDDDSLVDQKIEPIAEFEPKAFVHDRQRQLPVHCMATPLELMSETLLVDRLQEPRSERPMDLQTGVDNLARHGFDVVIHAFVSFRSFVSFVTSLLASAGRRRIS